VARVSRGKSRGRRQRPSGVLRWAGGSIEAPRLDSTMRRGKGVDKVMGKEAIVPKEHAWGTDLRAVRNGSSRLTGHAKPRLSAVPPEISASSAASR
jgi:hypothetical protein